MYTDIQQAYIPQIYTYILFIQFDYPVPLHLYWLYKVSLYPVQYLTDA